MTAAAFVVAWPADKTGEMTARTRHAELERATAAQLLLVVAQGDGPGEEYTNGAETSMAAGHAPDLDVPALMDCLRAMPWEDPERVVVMIMEDGDSELQVLRPAEWASS